MNFEISQQNIGLDWALGPGIGPGIGLGLGAVYAAVPALRRPIFRGWLWLAFPIGWVISHLLLAGVFFLTVTPIALLMRWVGRDPLDRTLDPDAPSYWEAYDPQGPASRYYHQS